ncbi:hypothetical protein [Moraxella sp. RCAD0137]|uniref:hypothetical protein n=1 Tax=Moraxella sp. RCAD0137 TaxID=1775913 RepID=UPI000C9FE507|nr:hypothetical protein [Moraxella sp. RCAD0137]
MSIHVQGHAADPVHGVIGFNSSTGGTVSTEKVGKLKETALIIKEAGRSVLGKETTAHNCYGVGDPKCENKGLLENGEPMTWEPVYKPKQDTTPTTQQNPSLCTNSSSTDKQKCNNTN